MKEGGGELPKTRTFTEGTETKLNVFVGETKTLGSDTGI